MPQSNDPKRGRAERIFKAREGQQVDAPNATADQPVEFAF
jgi:hypothetical protein